MIQADPTSVCLRTSAGKAIVFQITSSENVGVGMPLAESLSAAGENENSGKREAEIAETIDVGWGKRLMTSFGSLCSAVPEFSLTPGLPRYKTH